MPLAPKKTQPTGFGSLSRRVQIQADNVRRLGLEFRVVGGNISLEPMRLQVVFGPEASHRHVRYAATQFGRQLARGPVRRAVGQLAPSGPRQHPRLHTLGHFVALASGVACEQTGQPLGLESLAPATDIAVAAVKLRTNLGPGAAFGQQQHKASAPR